MQEMQTKIASQSTLAVLIINTNVRNTKRIADYKGFAMLIQIHLYKKHKYKLQAKKLLQKYIDTRKRHTNRGSERICPERMPLQNTLQKPVPHSIGGLN